MNVLYPAFLAGAVAIAIPIVLHFMRRDIAPEVPFSAVRLLRRSPIARSRRRRLRDLLLLAARIAALILLAAAFARPYLAGAAAASSLRIIAVDRSLSMSAPGEFARGLSLANRAIDEAAADERIAVIAFDDRADIVGEPGTAGAARAALDTLKAGAGATRYTAVLIKASEMAGLDTAHLVLVSDLQRSGWDGEMHAVVPVNLTVDVRDAGAPPGNMAVDAVRVGNDRLVAAIRNEGRAPWTGDVRLERDGRVVATASTVVPAASTVETPIAWRSPGTGSVTVSIDDPLGFAGDNRRYVITEPAARQSVLVITSGSPESGYYVVRALAAAADDMETRVVSVPTLTQEELRKHAAIVLLSTRGMERRARETVADFVRAGGGLLVAASPEVEPVLLSTTFNWRPALNATEQAGGSAVLSATDVRHPILRPFGALAANFGQIRFETTWRVPESGWDAAARFSDGTPALLERREGRGRVVLFASDLDRRWNDFPLHPVYVPFVVEAVRYVRAQRDIARDYLVASPPRRAQARPGVYRASGDNRLVAVNVDPRESAIATLPAADFLSMIDRVQPADGGARDTRARQVEARQSYWQYGLLLMLAALVAESFVGRA